MKDLSCCQDLNHASQRRPGIELTRVELDVVLDLGCSNVELDGIIDLDEGIWVTDGAAIVGYNVGYSLGGNAHLAHFAQLVLKHRNKRN